VSLRVLVADDSVLFRKVITDALSSLPDIEVVGSASNGKVALQKVRELKPDLLTLDMEMPEMDGIAVLDALRVTKENTFVIVVSALTKLGGDLTMRALEKGAFDFITKPEGSGQKESLDSIRSALAPRVRAIAGRLEIRNILRTGTARAAVTESKQPAAAPGLAAAVSATVARASMRNRPDLVLIGVSTGGPNALAKLLPALPRDLGIPVLIVQHMPPVFTKSLAESLSGKCAIRVREAAQGDVIEPNTAYIAPGGKQMRLIAGADNRRTIQITDDPPENNCKPAVDYLFRSVANTFPGKAMVTILTGMGSDGTIGTKLLKRHGCFVIAQDEASCVVYGMPKAIVEAGVSDAVLPLEEIAGRIVSTVRGTAR
jgi:two-component system chemotaxis response regulator CheB